MGGITDTVRRLVPGSYRAMIGPSEATSYYSLTDLQALADVVKFRLFATVVAAAAESTLYDPLLVNFLGKVTTLQFIPAAVDYWGDQLISESTQGTAENVTYPDRRPELWNIFNRLWKEVQDDFDNLGPEYGFQIYGAGALVPKVSYGDNGRGVLLTPDPMCFPRAYVDPLRVDPINWTDPV
jgi:hypothetical protein